LVVLNEDRYIKLVSYRANNVTLTRDNVGTRSSAVAIRTFINPNDRSDLKTGKTAGRGEGDADHPRRADAP